MCAVRLSPKEVSIPLYANPGVSTAAKAIDYYKEVSSARKYRAWPARATRSVTPNCGNWRFALHGPVANFPAWPSPGAGPHHQQFPFRLAPTMWDRGLTAP